MRIRAIISSMFATWYVGMILALVLLVPTIQALIFALRCLFWVLSAIQTASVGLPPPAF